MDDLIRAHLAWARAAGMSPNTITTRAVVLHMAHRQLPNGLMASDGELAEWLGNDAWKPKTRATYHEHLAAFFTWAVDVAEELDWSPMSRLKRPRVPRGLPRPVTDTQLATLLGARQPYRLAVVLAAYAGLRCCEIVGLSWPDVDQDRIRVVGKGRKVAQVDTHPRVWAELRHFPGSGPFIVQAGGPASPKQLSTQAARYFRTTLDLHVSLHQCRHWYGTEILAQTNNLEAARMALRHSSVVSTQGYAMLKNGQRRLGILALPVLDQAAS
jgi:integrase